MKQIIQNLLSGETILDNIPAPGVRPAHLFIKTTCSLVSLGTERMLVDFGRSSLISKASQQPERVLQVLNKIKSDGFLPTLESVFNKLEQPLPLGYCNAGIVVAVGNGVSGFKVGDRVASNGPHAEYVCVPQNLVAHIPDNISDEEATFTVIGSIALQGIRLLNPTFGETMAVIGLGLVGLLTAELLIANGCKVIGFDIDEKKIDIAKNKGIFAINVSRDQDPVHYATNYSHGIGVDGVIITASSKNNEIISQAARMSRKRGRIVLVGVTGLQLNRAEFYEKELSFQVSCSYGPGRYDDNYENKGNDYPLPFVRWTEQRNFQAVLEAISSGKLDVKPLITDRIALKDYQQIYDNISQGNSVASILIYPADASPSSSIVLSDTSFSGQQGIVGIVGAGNFTKMTLLPKLKKNPLIIKTIASAGGLNGTSLAKKYGVLQSTTDYKAILGDPHIDLVMITTRHNMHASITSEALLAGKHVFVEKPLALNQDQLDQVISAHSQSGKTVTVGFNRRFSPHVQKMKSILGEAPMQVTATMNAGFIPETVWVNDLQIGGGRIIGEACHFIDLITYLTGGKVISVFMQALGIQPMSNTDNASILLKFDNGSTGVINYFSNGNKKYSKERVEVYSQERILILDNFIRLKGYGFRNFSSMNTSQDKGHKNQFDLLADRIINGGDPLIPFESLVNTTLASFAAIESLQSGELIKI